MQIKTKNLILTVSIVLTVLVAVTSTVAFIMTESDKKINTFEPANVSCEVAETFADGVKSNVRIKNTGNTEAFIRAFITVNFISVSDGKIYANAPVENTDYTIDYGNNWIKGADGFWYYTEAIAPEKATLNLIDRAEAIGSAPEGYRLSVEIIATALQSEPVSVVSDAWGITPQNGLLVQ